MNKYDLIKQLLKIFNIENQYFRIVPFVAMMSDKEVLEKTFEIQSLLNDYQMEQNKKKLENKENGI